MKNKKYPKIALILLAFALLLLTLESIGYLGFFVAYRETPNSYSDRTFRTIKLYQADHPYLPYIATKGQSGFINFNSLGNRGSEPEITKTKKRIITFGGSTTFDGAHIWDETWPGYLQSLLGGEYEVINAAQNGATTADTLVNLALIQIDLEPDFILVYHGTNDLESSYYTNFRSDYSHRRRDIQGMRFPIFEKLPDVFDHSSIVVLTRRLLEGKHGDLHTLYTRPGNKYDFSNGPFGLQTFKRNLIGVNAIAEAHDSKLIIGTFLYNSEWAKRTMGKDFANAWEFGINIQNDIIRNLSNQYQNIYVDDIASNFVHSDDYFVDFVHLTKKGNLFIANEFYSAIKDIENK